MTEANSEAGIVAALGDAGPCPVVTYNKKPWSVGHATQRAKAELELQVVQVALRNIDRLKSVLPAQVWQQKSAALDAQIAGGHYQTWGSLWTAVNNGPDGTALFLLSLLRERHPEATLEDAAGILRYEPRQVQHAMSIVVPGFFKLLAETAPVPPEKRTALVLKATAEFMESLGQDASSVSATTAS